MSARLRPLLFGSAWRNSQSCRLGSCWGVGAASNGAFPESSSESSFYHTLGQSCSVRSFHASSTRRADYYKTLSVSPTASSAEIKQSFYKLAKKYHPDAMASQGSSPETVEAGQALFAQISEAYETLGNEDSRQSYDRQQRLSQPFGHETSGFADTHGGRSAADAQDMFVSDDEEDFFLNMMLNEARRAGRNRSRGKMHDRDSFEGMGMEIGGGWFIFEDIAMDVNLKQKPKKKVKKKEKTKPVVRDEDLYTRWMDAGGSYRHKPGKKRREYEERSNVRSKVIRGKRGVEDFEFMASEKRGTPSRRTIYNSNDKRKVIKQQRKKNKAAGGHFRNKRGKIDKDFRF